MHLLNKRRNLFLKMKIKLYEQIIGNLLDRERETVTRGRSRIVNLRGKRIGGQTINSMVEITKTEVSSWIIRHLQLFQNTAENLSQNASHSFQVSDQTKTIYLVGRRNPIFDDVAQSDSISKTIRFIPPIRRNCVEISQL